MVFFFPPMMVETLPEMKLFLPHKMVDLSPAVILFPDPPAIKLILAVMLFPFPPMMVDSAMSPLITLFVPQRIEKFFSLVLLGVALLSLFSLVTMEP